MTNREKLKELTDAELAGAFREFASNEAWRHIDLEKWLGSENPEYPVKGNPAMLVSGGKSAPCTIVSREDIFGEPYYGLVTRERGGALKLLRVPAKSVTACEPQEDGAE